MSAFLVEDKTINGIATSVYDSQNEAQEEVKVDLQEIGIKSREDLGQAMFDLNVYSLEQRYGSAEGFRELDYKYNLIPDVGKFQILKSLRCFLYQACEGNTPETSKLYKLLNLFSNSLALDIVSSLPEYERADWA